MSLLFRGWMWPAWRSRCQTTGTSRSSASSVAVSSIWPTCHTRSYLFRTCKACGMDVDPSVMKWRSSWSATGTRFTTISNATPLAFLTASPSGGQSPGPLRPRLAADGGRGDRKDIFDSDGVQVRSINTMCGLSEMPQTASWVGESENGRDGNSDGESRDDHPKWPKEVNPRHSDMMVGLSVLLQTAGELGEPVFFFTCDASNFFNQMALAPSEHWYCTTLMYDYKQDLLMLAQEYVMAFGLTPASNIAQRIAHLIVTIIRKNFDEEEELFMDSCTDAKACAWWAARQELSRATGHNEARWYVLEMYTDDPMGGGVVGVDRMVRFLTCWTRCTRRMRLLMAIASNRQLGCSVKWIGARYYIIGVLLITKERRLKAMHDLHLLLAHDLNCGDLRSLNGLLEFVLVVMCLRCNWMAGISKLGDQLRLAQRFRRASQS